MKGKFSTRQAAGKFGVSLNTLQRHIRTKTIAAPRLLKGGPVIVRLWTKHDIEKARKVLFGIRPRSKKKV